MGLRSKLHLRTHNTMYETLLRLMIIYVEMVRGEAVDTTRSEEYNMHHGI